MGETDEFKDRLSEQLAPSDDALRLCDLYDNSLTDKAIYSLASNLATPAPIDDILLQEDPALWRALALLELLRIMPNPKDLTTYENVVLSATRDFDTRLTKLTEIEDVRNKAKGMVDKLEIGYLAIINPGNLHRLDIIRAATESIVDNAHTNVIRAVEAMRDTGEIDTREINRIAMLLGYLLSADSG